MELILLKTKEETVSGKGVISRLEEALEMAKEGLIDNVFIAATGTNKTVMRSWANVNEPFLMLGLIEDAKIDFMSTAIERK